MILASYITSLILSLSTCKTGIIVATHVVHVKILHRKEEIFACVSISGWRLSGMMKGRHLAQFLAHGWHLILAESPVQGQVSGKEERSEE